VVLQLVNRLAQDFLEAKRRTNTINLGLSLPATWA